MNKYNEIEIQTAKNLLKEGYKWIVRYRTGRLFAHSDKPNKGDDFWWSVGNSVCVCKFVPIFQSVHFVDKEPVSLEGIVHPQILDDDEKKYLSAVIKPFREKVDFIAKSDMAGFPDCSYIYIHFTCETDDMYFPSFRDRNMYKGMEKHKKYTPDELGL